MLVGGLNMVQRHTAPSQGDPQGGIKTQGSARCTCPTSLWSIPSGKPTRVGFRVEGEQEGRVAKNR